MLSEVGSVATMSYVYKRARVKTRMASFGLVCTSVVVVVSAQAAARIEK